MYIHFNFTATNRVTNRVWSREGEGGVVKTALYTLQVWNKNTATENTEELKVKVCRYKI